MSCRLSFEVPHYNPGSGNLVKLRGCVTPWVQFGFKVCQTEANVVRLWHSDLIRTKTCSNRVPLLSRPAATEQVNGRHGLEALIDGLRP